MEFTDLKIRVGEKTFPVHKIVIASYSPVFRRMLQTDMLEKSTGEISIEDATPEVIKLMIDYIYNGYITVAYHGGLVGLNSNRPRTCHRVQNGYKSLVLYENRLSGTFWNLFLPFLGVK